MWAQKRRKFEKKSVLLYEQEIQNFSIHYEDDQGRIWILPYSHFESAQFVPSKDVGLLQVNYHGWKVVLEGHNLEEASRALNFQQVETVIQKAPSPTPPETGKGLLWVSGMEVTKRSDEDEK